MTPGRKLSRHLVLLLAALLLPLPVSGMPGFYVGKREAKRFSYSAHVVLMMNGKRTAVTVMTDYDGPFEPFALVMPVPADVTMERVSTLKRDVMDRIEVLTAPRVHHFWEKDPCSLGKARQIWERNLKVDPNAVNVLGDGQMDFSGGGRKVPREMTWYLQPEYKDGEYTFTLLRGIQADAIEQAEKEAAQQADKDQKAEQAAAKKKPAKPPVDKRAQKRAQEAKAEKAAKAKAAPNGKPEEAAEEPAAVPATELVPWLKSRGYVVSPEAEKAIAPYVAAGMSVLVAEVDEKSMELIGGSRALLSPIRYYTDQPFNKIPDTLGLLNLDQAQELFVYTLDPSRRFEIGNYPNFFPPTNLEIVERLGPIWVQERLGEIYANLQDRLVKQHPGAFLSEYAWSTKTCGEPCSADEFQLFELLSLGGDVLDQVLPESVQHPEPPAVTEEEEKAFKEELKELKPLRRREVKQEREAERWEVARRKALGERHQYVLSRMHARYDRNFLKRDVEVVPANAVEGGDLLPHGVEGKLPIGVKPAPENKYQIRFVTMHPWIGVLKCEKPERGRWGEEWFEIRRLNKIWVAQDLSRKRRDRTKLDDVAVSPVPELGIKGQPRPVSNASDAGVDGGADGGLEAGTEPEPAAKRGCGCRAAGAPGPSRAAGALAVLFLAAFGLRRGLRGRAASSR